MQKTYTSMIQVQTLKSEGLSNSVIARKVGLRINPRTLDTYSLNLDFSYRFTFFKPEFLLPLIPGF